MKPLLSLTVVFFLCSSSALFAASLTIPMKFEYVTLDGKKVSSGKFMHKSNLQLDQGSRRVALRYSDMVDNDVSDTKESVQSTVFVVTLRVDGNFKYTLAPEGGDRVSNPEQFAKSPNVVVTRGNGGAVEYEVTQTGMAKREFMSALDDSDKLAGTAFVPVSAAPAAATTPSESVAVSTEVLGNSSQVQPAATVVPASAATTSELSATEMLQKGWQQADEKTRKEFLSWAIRQL